MTLNKQGILNDLFRTSPILNSEDDCAENIVVPFLLRLGYVREQIRRKVSITGTSGNSFRKQADIVVYIENRPAMVVETKKLQHRLREEDVNQAMSYAQLLSPAAVISILTNGRDWEVYHFSNNDIGSIDDVPEPDVLSSYLQGAATEVIDPERRAAAERLLTTIENRNALEEAFRKCRQLLAREGLIAESAFDELTKILVCKFNEEKRVAEGLGANRFRVNWLAGEGPLTGLRSMFADAKQRFHVFGANAQMQIRNNQTVIDIVGVLEPFGFYGFRTPLGLAGAGGDVVGSVYETFLTGTLRGDLGQYLTPRQLVEFMIELADIKVGERILDLSCGSGGFLIRSFIDVRKKIRSMNVPQEQKDLLISDLVNNHLWGVEINPRLATLCRINMILHGDGYEHIYTGDAIREDIFTNTDNRTVDFTEIENEHLPKFDVILMNPPFNIPYDDATTLNRYNLGRGKPAQGSDYLIMERALRLLKEDTGRILIIMPHGIASGTSETEVRQFLKSNSQVTGCISLPVGAFKPFGGSNARTCILHLQKTTNSTSQRFLAQAEQVGYDITSKYYKTIDANDLPVITEFYHRTRSV